MQQRGPSGVNFSRKRGRVYKNNKKTNMSIRLPLQVFSFTNNDEVGAGSTAGGIALPFVLPQDVDNVVVKMTASTVGGAISATFQTTDDGGSTWYDVARTSVVSNANNATAQWLSIPVISAGQGTGVIQTTSSVYQATIGSAAASSLGAQRMSGLPLLSQQARIFLRITGDISTSSILTQVKANSQSATA